MIGFCYASSVVDPKLLNSDPDPTCQVNTDPDPACQVITDPDPTYQVVLYPNPDPSQISFVKSSQDFSF